MEVTADEMKSIERDYYRFISMPKKSRPDAISYETICAKADEYKTSDEKFLFVWLYLTGQRISEAIELTRANVSLVNEDGREFIAVDSISLKNRKRPRREILIPRTGYEQRLATWAWNHIEAMAPEKPLFHFTRQMAFNHLAKVKFETQFQNLNTKRRHVGSKPFNPHYLRHCRATHLREYHRYDALRLMDHFGWVTATMASVYVHPSRKAMAEGFKHEQPLE
jgi:integrase